ncbi:MAG: DUF2752 domain-containing protein [Pirellulales bacterium]
MQFDRRVGNLPHPFPADGVKVTLPQGTPKLARAERGLLLGLAIVVLSLLMVAWRLEPDRRGFGTHEQLGLPPCAMRRLLGIRCPSCGMTTSWVHLVHGRFRHAVASNAGGALLGVMGIFGLPWLCMSAATGHYAWIRPTAPVVLALSAMVLVTTVTDWLTRWWTG